VEVPAVAHREMTAEVPGESSATIRVRVVAARQPSVSVVPRPATRGEAGHMYMSEAVVFFHLPFPPHLSIGEVTTHPHVRATDAKSERYLHLRRLLARICKCGHKL